MELQKSLLDFERHHIVPFAISYDAVDVLATFTAKQHITYTLLSDEGSTVIRALGLLNERVFEHHAAYGVPKRDQHWGVPYPGVFLLDEQGYVRQKRFQQSYRERETGVALLEQGFGLPSTVHGPPVHAQAQGVQVTARLDSPTYRAFQRLWLRLDISIEADCTSTASRSPRVLSRSRSRSRRRRDWSSAHQSSRRPPCIGSMAWTRIFLYMRGR